MEPSTVVAPKAKPPSWWVPLTIAAGIVGALAGIAVAGSGTYTVSPFKVSLEARLGPAGKTELAIQPDALAGAGGQTEAGTHAGPLIFRAAIVDASAPPVSADRARVADPYSMATFMRDEGKTALRSFAIKLATGAAAGALAAGLAISLGRWRRAIGALISGVLTFALLGLLVQQTYDIEEFRRAPAFTLLGPGGTELPAP